jgi:hypothetical protein
MLWTDADSRRLEQRLRELLARGVCIEEAIRTIRTSDGPGALFLSWAAEAVTGLSAIEAKRLVIRSEL